jgi:hypothetical protein
MILGARRAGGRQHGGFGDRRMEEKTDGRVREERGGRPRWAEGSL